MSDEAVYTLGGTVQASGGIYISRDADEELLRLCRAGEFCYVLTARQMGKSSLMVATKERLAVEDIRSVEIDLTPIGTKLSGLSAEQWYLGLIDLIVDQLDLGMDYRAWWEKRAYLGPTQRLSQFLRQVVLERVSSPVVIFIDEIDHTLNLDFRDDFFAAIRACYNARASDSAFKRLSFVLLGVATPSDLIRDPQRTPFNIGQRIDLADFTYREATPLATGLHLPPAEAGQALTLILDWTGGHPYLTQRLCAAVAASPTKNWDVAAVDHLVERTFFGEHSAQDSNLLFVRDMLTKRAPDKAAVLETYRRIHAGEAIHDEERSLAKTHLKLSGIVKAKDGCLHVRNEIYRRVFDLAWVSENTPPKVNWASIAVVATVIAVMALAFILYNGWVGIQAQDSVANFHQAKAPEERVVCLVRLFKLQSLFGLADYDYKAVELFYGLSRREEQLALFAVRNVDDSDLIVLIKGLYITLADADGTNSTQPILEAMADTLKYRIKETEETKNLQGEIYSWLNGRKLAGQNRYTDALAAYDEAINWNDKNPATLYERAKVSIKLAEYPQALSDLDRIVAIARQLPAPTPTPIPTITPTDTPASPPTTTPTAVFAVTPALTPSPTLIPAVPSVTATPVPASIISEFATTAQMINAVRGLINNSPELISLLVKAPSSEYPNLHELVVPTPTPAPTEEPTLPLAATPPSPSAEAIASQFSNLVLARGIDKDHHPVEPGKEFAADAQPIYLFFDYRGMKPGVRWGHVWTKGEQELDRSITTWPEDWGSAGTGWVFYVPEGGYQPGVYTVRLLVNDQTVAFATFAIEQGVLGKETSRPTGTPMLVADTSTPAPLIDTPTAFTPAPIPTNATATQLQFQPKNISAREHKGLTRFQGHITDQADNPVNGFFLYFSCGDFHVMSFPTGPSSVASNWAPGWYDQYVASSEIDCDWTIQVVMYKCDRWFDAQCTQFDVLSPAAHFRTKSGQTDVTADWWCNLDCDKGVKR